MNASEVVTAAYEALDQGDVDRLMGVLGDSLVAIPGSTRISGDHSGGELRRVAIEIITAIGAGRLKRELVCTYKSDDGVMAVFDNFTGDDPGAAKYHTAEEWVCRDGALVAWMIYVHEYDVFEAAWR